MKVLKPIWLITACLITAAFICSGCVSGTQEKNDLGGGSDMGFDNGSGFNVSEKYSSLDVNPVIPAQSLPYSEQQLSNLDNVREKIPIGGAEQKLLENGFVVMENPFNPQEQDIVRPYKNLEYAEIPVFVTTDSLLHLYHIQFDETLRQIEEQELYDQIFEMSNGLLEENLEIYKSEDGEVKEAAKRNIAFLSVGLSLLDPDSDQIVSPDVSDDAMYMYDPSQEGLFSADEADKYSFSVPESVSGLVSGELALIDQHSGFSDSPVFHYPEDYSQYVPRGHYTRSEKLKNYFKAMMWYGRMSFLLKGGSEGLISEEDARIQTYSAVLLSDALSQNPELMENWDRVYSITAFFVGTSDDLGPYEYLWAMKEVFGSSFNPDDLNQESYNELKTVLATMPSPKIYGGTGKCEIYPPFTAEKADKCLESTKGFRLMGQRFVPDSYIFSKLTGAYTGYFTGTGSPFTLVGDIRGFPMGLDLFSLLGSERSAELILETGNSDYSEYAERLSELQTEFDSFDQADWHRNLYWAWLYSLVPLTEPVGTGYPAFMQNAAWNDKSLSTALASWAELRHDTILYAKQSYTMKCTAAPPSEEPEPPAVGYVEPNPEFYNRLLTLTTMTKDGLSEFGVLDEYSKQRLINLENILERLVDISVRELENQPLSQDDYDFINDFGDRLDAVVGDVDEKSKRTTIVADVHTDTNSAQVLEEGVGYVNLMLVAYAVPDGRVIVGAGPVMSYYEFKQPMSERLTDEAWREMLISNPPDYPVWCSSYMEV